MLGAALAVVSLPMLTWRLSELRGDIAVSTALALYLLAVVVVSAVGGSLPGLLSALAAPLLANWYFIPPYHTLRVSEAENLVELVVFVSTAAVVSGYVTLTTRREVEAAAASREAETLAALATSSNIDAIGAILDLMRETFGFEAAALVVDGEPSHVTVSSGDPAPGDITYSRRVSDRLTLVAGGPQLSAADARLADAFAGRISLAIDQRELRERALEADALSKADELRTAILRAVSHDLRSPLSAIKASVSSLRQSDVAWTEQERQEFLWSIESETDRLTRIVTNLLDLSRLEAGVMSPAMRRVSLEEVVPSVVQSLGPGRALVGIDLPEALPDVWADPALLERVVENLVLNAVKWSPADSTVTVVGTVEGPDVRMSVVDHGPGIPEKKRHSVTQPFQRLGDEASGSGLGLGLAIVDRMVSAMNGDFDLSDTPGGGLTATVSLRRMWTEAP